MRNEEKEEKCGTKQQIIRQFSRIRNTSHKNKVKKKNSERVLDILPEGKVREVKSSECIERKD